MKKSLGGISLIILLITIVIIIIISSAIIMAITGNNPIENSRKAKFLMELNSINDELESFCNDMRLNEEDFSRSSVWAGEDFLQYDGKPTSEEGNITNISKTAEKYLGKVEFEEGKIVIQAASMGSKESEWAMEAGYNVNIFKFSDDDYILSADENLNLLPENGILVIPSKAKGIEEGAFGKVKGIKKIIIPGSVKRIGKNAFNRS